MIISRTFTDLCPMKINARQLSFLLYIQTLDDWHPQGLIKEIITQKETYIGNEEELTNLVNQINNLSVEQIQELQIGLNHFITVPVDIDF